MKKYLLILVFIPFINAFESCKSTNGIENTTIENKMVKALQWQEANPIQAKAPTDWTNGAYYTGVAKAHQATQNKEFLNALTEMGKRNKWQTWDRYFHADDVAISYPYLYLNSIGETEVDLKPTEDFIQDHLNKPHKWSGNIIKDEIEILWWWCDALFMAPPVLTLYSDLKNDTAYLDDMHRLYLETYTLLYDQEEHLFARDQRFLWKGEPTERKEKNGNKIFWSRGNGWVLGGLALILEDMPKEYEHRDFYVKLYKEMAAKIKDIQPEDGLWRTSLLSPESYDHGEVSGSGFYTFALTWGINNGLLDVVEYGPVVLKAWAALEKCQKENGKVGWVQQIGAAPNPVSKDSWQNYGTGAFLLAGSEIIKLKSGAK